jgi:hypothetical protein
VLLGVRSLRTQRHLLAALERAIIGAMAELDPSLISYRVAAGMNMGEAPPRRTVSRETYSEVP